MVLSRAEARQFFDERFYLNRNPDVRRAVNDDAFNSGLDHFLAFGIGENRAPNNTIDAFDESSYLDANPDVANAVDEGVFNSALEHFLAFGAAEGRNGTGLNFDESSYLDANPDVANAVDGGVFGSGLEHFVKFGFGENRLGITPPEESPTRPAPGFDDTIRLTRGGDQETGGDGDTLFVGGPGFDDISQIEANTLNSADVLNGGGGDNRLDATLTFSDGPVFPTLTDIQQLFLLGRGGGLQADDIVGVEEIWSSGSQAPLTVEGVGELVTVGMRNIEGPRDYTLQFAPSVLNEAEGEVDAALSNVDAEGAFLSISDGTTSGGVSTLNLQSVGGSNLLGNLLNAAGFTATDLQTVNIEGDANLEIDNPLPARINVLDASGLEASLDLDFSNSDRSKEITGSAGDSTFELGETGNSFLSGDSIDGGGGNNKVTGTLLDDELVDAPTLNNIQTLEIASQIAGDEVINLSEAPDLEQVIIESNNTQNRITLDQISSGVDVELQGNGQTGNQNLNSLRYRPDGRGDSVDIAINNDGTALGDGNTFTLNNLTVNQTNAINLDIQDGNLTLNTPFAGDVVSTLNLTGDQDFTAAFNANTPELTTINASEFTGDLDLSFNVDNDLNIRAGAGDDDITVQGNNDDRINLGVESNNQVSLAGGNNTVIAGQGADEITAGGGDDAFVYSDWRQSRPSADLRDTITNFEQGGNDVIRLSGIPGILDNTDLNNVGTTANVEASSNVGDWAFQGNILSVQTTTQASNFLQIELANNNGFNAAGDFEVV